MATRREFLQSTLGGLALYSLAPSVPGFLARTALGAPRGDAGDDTILIVIQLAGGNDGLNTIVPYADDRYARNRTTLRLSGQQVHKIDSVFGFHPQAEAFSRLYHEGHLSVMQGVGYPNPNRSHGQSMQIWQSANLDEANVQTGWLGRAVDRYAASGPSAVPALFIGQLARPFALNAEKIPVPAIHSLEDALVRTGDDPRRGAAARRHLTELAAASRPGGDALLDFVQRTSVAAYGQSEKVEEVLQRGSRAASPYPSLQLAGNLHAIAQLIRADLGIRIFFTELGGAEPGGFDNHAGQAANHGALLSQLAESLAAFVHDMAHDRLLDRVLVMTFSEFGRTLAENGRKGTDHGCAAPMFFAGGRIKPGLLGTAPNLVEIPGGGVRSTVDFRQIYATVLDRWLGFDSQAILGGRFAPVELLRA